MRICKPIFIGSLSKRRYDEAMAPLPTPRRSFADDEAMAPPSKPRRSFVPVARAFVEVAFIIFLFYSNLLMGEYEGGNGKGKTLAYALHDIFTRANFTIAVFSAVVGYLVFEFWRKKL